VVTVIMRRRPLLRAAAIGGGAYDAGKRRIDSLEKLNELKTLHAAGILTAEELAEKKARLLR
jgi:hypothetical protein